MLNVNEEQFTVLFVTYLHIDSSITAILLLTKP